MIMTPGLRKFALTAHITSSVSWLGAVAGFLALAVAGLTSQDAQMGAGRLSGDGVDRAGSSSSHSASLRR